MAAGALRMGPGEPDVVKVSVMKAYLLGLEQDFRGQATLDDCQRIGLDVEVFYGLDARKTSTNEINAIYSESSSRFAIDRPMSPPEVACAWGHQSMRAKFLRESVDEWAVFLEDDARIVLDAMPALDELRALPAVPLILTLVGRAPDTQVTGVIEAGAGRRFERLLDPPDFNTGYIANRLAVQLSVLAYEGKLIDSVADWPYRWSRAVQFWSADPPAIKIEQHGSLIEDQRSVLQQAATRRISPEWSHFMLCLTGVRLVQGLWLGYSPKLVWRHDVRPFIGRRQ